MAMMLLVLLLAGRPHGARVGPCTPVDTQARAHWRHTLVGAPSPTATMRRDLRAGRKTLNPRKRGGPTRLGLERQAGYPLGVGRDDGGEIQRVVAGWPSLSSARCQRFDSSTVRWRDHVLPGEVVGGRVDCDLAGLAHIAIAPVGGVPMCCADECPCECPECAMVCPC